MNSSLNLKAISCIFCTFFLFAPLLRADFESFVLSSKDRFIAGGIVGTFIGFGSGHAIENRYEQKGWIFTASEGICVVALLASYILPLPAPVSFSLNLGGSFGFLGFRVWEIVDLWTGSMPIRHAELPDYNSENRYADNLSFQRGVSLKF